MKHRIAAAVAAMAIGAVSASAYDVKVDGIYYNIIDGEYLEVTSENPYSGISFEPMLYGAPPMKILPQYAVNSYSGDIVIPDSVAVDGYEMLLPVKSVGYCAFFNALDLCSVTLPATIERLGDGSFAASSIKRLDIGNMKDLGREGKGLCYSCRELEEVVFPSGLTYIPQCAFKAAKIQHMTLPNTVRMIDVEAFAAADIETIGWPDSLENVASQAFDRSSLKEVTIPENVDFLSFYSFNRMASLERVVSLKIDPEGFDPHYIRTNMYVVFYGSNPDCTLWVPDGSLELYKASERWTSFFTDIRPLSQSGVEAVGAADGEAAPALFDLMGRSVTAPVPGRIYVGSDGRKIRF